MTSWYDFIVASEIAEGSWELVRLGAEGTETVLASGSLPALDINPRETKEFRVAVPRVENAPGVEHVFNVLFTLKDGTVWADAGHELAREQLFRGEWQAPLPVTTGRQVSLGETPTAVQVTGDFFALSIDKTTGLMTSFEFEGVPMLVRGPRPEFWRAMTDNDRGASWHILLGYFRGLGSRWEVTSVDSETINGGTAVRVVVTGTMQINWPFNADYTLEYIVHGSGDVDVKGTYLHGFTDPFTHLPRFGMELVLPEGFEQMAWNGRGPIESHSDRKLHQRVGIFSTAVADDWVEYSRPQENANKADVRWASWANEDIGVGLRVTALEEELLQVSARHYSIEDMDRKDDNSNDYTWQLTPRKEVYAYVDLAQSGIGGDNSWGFWPLDEYLLKNNRDYEYSYRITPYKV